MEVSVDSVPNSRIRIHSAVILSIPAVITFELCGAPTPRGPNTPPSRHQQGMSTQHIKLHFVCLTKAEPRRTLL